MLAASWREPNSESLHFYGILAHLDPESLHFYGILAHLEAGKHRCGPSGDSKSNARVLIAVALAAHSRANQFTFGIWCAQDLFRLLKAGSGPFLPNPEPTASENT